MPKTPADKAPPATPALRSLRAEITALRAALADQAPAPIPAAAIIQALQGKETDASVQALCTMIRHQRRLSFESAASPDLNERQATLECGAAAGLDTLLQTLTAALAGNASYLQAQGYL